MTNQTCASCGRTAAELVVSTVCRVTVCTYCDWAERLPGDGSGVRGLVHMLIGEAKALRRDLHDAEFHLYHVTKALPAHVPICPKIDDVRKADINLGEEVRDALADARREARGLSSTASEPQTRAELFGWEPAARTARRSCVHDASFRASGMCKACEEGGFNR